MKSQKVSTMAAVGILLAGLSPTSGFAVDHMVGLSPSDGVAMLVKQFQVPAGTTILGAQFMNNDSNTLFPEVLLIKGATFPKVSLAGPAPTYTAGTVVSSVTNVRESTFRGVVSVIWPEPILVSETTQYAVGVRLPSGPGKQGPDIGPAVGASDLQEPNGSFLISNPIERPMPIRADLAISLLTSGVDKAMTHTTPASDETPVGAELRTFLSIGNPNLANSSTKIRFGLGREGRVTLSVYDVTGRLIRTLLDESRGRGKYSIVWDGQDDTGRRMSSGIYFSRLKTADVKQIRKFVLVR